MTRTVHTIMLYVALIMRAHSHSPTMHSISTSSVLVIHVHMHVKAAMDFSRLLCIICVVVSAPFFGLHLLSSLFLFPCM